MCYNSAFLPRVKHGEYLLVLLECVLNYNMDYTKLYKKNI